MPHRLVREHVDAHVDAEHVEIFHGGQSVARHRRAYEPFSRVIDPAHYVGLWRTPSAVAAPAPDPLLALGRDLTAYADILTGGAQ